MTAGARMGRSRVSVAPRFSLSSRQRRRAFCGADEGPLFDAKSAERPSRHVSVSAPTASIRLARKRQLLIGPTTNLANPYSIPCMAETSPLPDYTGAGETRGSRESLLQKY